MAKFAISAYIADGSTTDYLITWNYLDSDHIAVYVDGTSDTDPNSTHIFNLINSTTVRITDELGNAIASGAELEIRRETPIQNRAVTFADGSALLAEDLNKNSDYLLYSMQEVLDTVESAAGDAALQAQTDAEANRDETLVLKNTTAGYLATVQADAADADAHRIAAAASEAAAAASETAAAASETAAAASETAAAASEAAAAASETAAQTAETGAIAAQTGVSAAQTASENARDAAQLAQTGAETAETNAAASETAAATSETNAATSATNAATSETNSANSAAASLASQNAAATSATNAATSESNAAASASAASTSETNAAASETAAAASQVAAATSASNAATSETNAATSETAAASSETAAEAAWESLDQRYLGAKSTAPTVDNSGNAIINGALYWNTSDSTMYVYNNGWGVTQSGLAAVATSGDYNDLVNVPPATASSLVQYASDPASASEGDVYYNTTSDSILFYNGNSWVDISNTAPTSTGGTVVLTSQNSSTSFSYDLATDFSDNEDAATDLTFTGGNLPSGISLPSSGATVMSGTLPTVTQDTTYTFSVTATDTGGAQATQNYSITVLAITSGEQVYTSAGTYTWVAPAGVNSVNVVAVGGGGGGGLYFGWGGGGGGLGWKNNIPVTSGNSYTVVVGAGGVSLNSTITGSDGDYSAGSASSGNGGDSYFISGSTVAGLGGTHGAGHNVNSGPTSRAWGGNYVGDGGGSGGHGWGPYNTSYGVNYLSSGGGGAGGYTGNGGNGAGSDGAYNDTFTDATNGSGGGGGGGSSRLVDTNTNSYGGAGGGGVGLYGLGTSGAVGTFNSTTSQSTLVSGTGGQGGSGGSNGGDSTVAQTGGPGGAYGGGGGSGHGTAATSYGGVGGSGAVRIMWGTGRSFPNNAT
jgi:hypothetical protein